MRLLTDVSSRVCDPYLRRAAELAEHARGRTAPNPLVGCVVVRDGRIVGEGYHPRAGEPHAEVFALAAAGDAARGSDVYVTLEPCSHHGRTPPCVEALIAAGVRRVVVGMPDPNAEAAGGAVLLRAAGIEVVFAEDPSPFEALNEGWLKRLSAGRPFVTVKLALTLDARLALAEGERASITGSSGAAVTRTLRTAADAVLIGASTARSDDPALTVRGENQTLAEEQPLRVVVARSHVPASDTRLLSDGAAPTLVIVVGEKKLAGEHAEHVVLAQLPADATLADTMRVLGDRGVNDVLVEAGPRLFGGLLAEGLVDELVTVTAGGFGGSDAPGVTAHATIVTESELDRVFSPVETGIVGDVVATTWRPREAV